MQKTTPKNFLLGVWERRIVFAVFAESVASVAPPVWLCVVKIVAGAVASAAVAQHTNPMCGADHTHAKAEATRYVTLRAIISFSLLWPA